MTKFQINPEYSQLQSWLLSVPELLKNGVGESLWEGRNIVRILTAPDGQKFVAKQFKIPMLHQRIDYSFIRPSKARRAYDFANRFIQQGIVTPKPIAWIEIWHGGLFHHGYFISKYVPGIELRKPIESGKATPGMIQAIVALISDLHAKGILHGDLNLTNMLAIVNENDKWYINLVDNNRTKFLKKPITIPQRAHNLRRLTHVRSALIKLATAYAQQNNLSKQEFTNLVLHELDKFEK